MIFVCKNDYRLNYHLNALKYFYYLTYAVYIAHRKFYKMCCHSITKAKTSRCQRDNSLVTESCFPLSPLHHLSITNYYKSLINRCI